MSKTILLTSFQPWLAHHQSNSADDLLELLLGEMSIQEVNGYQLECLRHLPVDGDIASQMAIDFIATIQPQLIICCGMAESYRHLTIESQASCEDVYLKTTVDLDKLSQGLSVTQISNDAGKFVCEALYFRVLTYVRNYRSHSHCIFVHVPILTDRHHPQIVSDFCRILSNLTLMYD
jgi:pyroglutamyl-peptidase